MFCRRKFDQLYAKNCDRQAMSVEDFLYLACFFLL